MTAGVLAFTAGPALADPQPYHGVGACASGSAQFFNSIGSNLGVIVNQILARGETGRSLWADCA